MLRGFSGAEKLAYPDEVRECILEHGSLSLHTLVGCPPSIFYRIGRVLESAKDYLSGKLDLDPFKVILCEAEKVFRRWDPDQAVYPTQDPEWKQLAEAYRQACILRILRFPDAFAIPCDDERIKTPVSIILDICAQMPRDSVFYKRLLLPLFMAGADASSAHQMHYVSLCIEDIKRSTGYRHQVVTDLLESVWEERRLNTRGWVNVPWMEFVRRNAITVYFQLPADIFTRLAPRFFRHNVSYSFQPRTHLFMSLPNDVHSYQTPGWLPYLDMSPGLFIVTNPRRHRCISFLLSRRQSVTYRNPIGCKYLLLYLTSSQYICVRVALHHLRSQKLIGTIYGAWSWEYFYIRNSTKMYRRLGPGDRSR